MEKKIAKRKLLGQNGRNSGQQAHKNNKCLERKQMGWGSPMNEVVSPWEL